jgi:hypothetical protein
MAPAAVLAQEPVAQDRIEPREQVGAGFEAICGLLHPQEGVLDEIIGTMVSPVRPNANARRRGTALSISSRNSGSRRTILHRGPLLPLSKATLPPRNKKEIHLQQYQMSKSMFLDVVS